MAGNEEKLLGQALEYCALQQDCLPCQIMNVVVSPGGGRAVMAVRRRQVRQELA